MHLRRLGVFIGGLSLLGAGGAAGPPVARAATLNEQLAAWHSTNAFVPGARYCPVCPRRKASLASPAARAATPAQVEQCVTAWASAAPNRVRVVEYARSHEGRALRYVIVTAPRNLWRLDEIQAGLAKLGDPRHVNDAEARESIERLPAVAWLAYTIHGDETEGSDAALAILYHLLASEDPPVEQLLQDVVMILDPLMNPDGRERFATMIAEHGSR